MDTKFDATQVDFSTDNPSFLTGNTSVLKEQTKMPGMKRYRYFQGGKILTKNDNDGNIDSALRPGRKRPHGDHSVIKNKISKSNPKTSTSFVNERYPGLEYKFDDVKGPAHEPCFTVRVFFPPHNKEYVAIGGSKKIAKNNVATMILKDLGVDLSTLNSDESVASEALPQELIAPLGPNSHGVPHVLPLPQPSPQPVDFSSDDVIFQDDFGASTGIGTSECTKSLDLSYYINMDPKLVQRISNIPNLDENACLAINCLMSPKPAVYQEISSEGPAHNKTFVYKLTVMSLETVGQGASKKKAKADAARQALMELFGPGIFSETYVPSTIEPETLTEVEMKSEECDTPDDPLNTEYTLAFSDRINRMVMQKYDAIMRDDPENAAQKVLAAVIMTRGTSMMDTAQVIVVTTGTKCIEGDSMSDMGIAVNDCHAEILATRCLRDFFYTQLEALVMSGANSSIFDYSDGTGGYKFQLKDDIRFHLYISTSPCGDARIFSPKGCDYQAELSQLDVHPNRLNRGVLRAKIEAGEGTIPVSNLSIAGVQTWDAILQGNALNTMSCSDKLCRWNILGFQGALLSTLMKPTYYSSITLGSLHHPVHFRRAIVGRIEPLETQDLPDGFRVNKPHRLMVSCEEPRRVKKSPNHAIAWCITWSCHEVLSAPRGRCKMGSIPSRVSKRNAFMKFLKFYNRESIPEEQRKFVTYSSAKLLATSYQECKIKFQNLMESSGFGKWISKPVEQDSFVIDTS